MLIDFTMQFGQGFFNSSLLFKVVEVLFCMPVFLFALTKMDHVTIESLVNYNKFPSVRLVDCVVFFCIDSSRKPFFLYYDINFVLVIVIISRIQVV